MARGASGARRPRREPASRVPGCPGAPRGRARRLPFALPPARRGGEPTRGPPRRGARGCWLLSWAAKAEGGGRGPPRRRAETKKMCPVRSNDIFPMPRGTGAARSVAGPPPGRPRGGAARLHHATPSRLHHAIPPAAASPQTATGHLPAPPSLSPQVRPGSQAKASLSGTGGSGPELLESPVLGNSYTWVRGPWDSQAGRREGPPVRGLSWGQREGGEGEGPG